MIKLQLSDFSINQRVILFLLSIVLIRYENAAFVLASCCRHAVPEDKLQGRSTMLDSLVNSAEVMIV